MAKVLVYPSLDSLEAVEGQVHAISQDSDQTARSQVWQEDEMSEYLGSLGTDSPSKLASIVDQMLFATSWSF